jgi:hypothetical protein
MRVLLANALREDNSALAAFVYLSQVFRVDSFIYRLFQLYIRDNRFPPLHHSPPP